MPPSAPSRDFLNSKGARGRRLFATALLPSAFMVIAAAAAGRSFTWNFSPSMPRGLYLLEPGKAAELGSTVVFPVPDSLRPIVLARGYLPGGANLLKVVVALPGDAARVRDNSLV
jgi:type IV secretory pathway protease TraF